MADQTQTPPPPAVKRWGDEVEDEEEEKKEEGPCEVFVGNLPYKMSPMETAGVFGGEQVVQDVRVGRDAEGRPNGTAQVVFFERKDLEEALRRDGAEIAGRRIRVSLSAGEGEAVPESPASPRKKGPVEDPFAGAKPRDEMAYERKKQEEAASSSAAGAAPKKKAAAPKGKPKKPAAQPQKKKKECSNPFDLLKDE